MKTKNGILYLSLTGAACAGALLLIGSSAQAQNLYAADWYSPGTIYSIAPGGATAGTFSSGGFGEPEGIAFDNSGNLFVADSLNGVIDKITSGGVETPFASGLNNPDELAFNAAGDLFEDDHSGSINEFTPAGVKTSFATGLIAPAGLAFNTTGDLFAEDSGNGDIYEYTQAGTRTTFATGLINPVGLAFSLSGNLFASFNVDGATDIDEFTPTGAKIPFFSGIPSLAGQLAFNRAGDLFSAAGVNGIDEITPNGYESTYISGLGNVTGIAFQGQSLPVPEPSALGLLGAGALISLAVRRVKKLKTGKA
jgi:sugar lactone lactonase YvrE